MISLRGQKLKIFAAVLAMIAIAAGIYMLFFESRGFVSTTATITDLERSYDSGDDDDTFIPTVEYTFDGKTYTGQLNQSSGSYRVGKTITVMVDPNDPSVVHGDCRMGLYFIGVGAVVLTVLIVTEIRRKKSLSELKSRQAADGGTTYPESVPGSESWLYFLTDAGTMKVGHRLEDANRHVLYEAKMTKHTLMTPFSFDFIDHEHGKTTPHLIGHEESTDAGNSLLFDNHYTFTFDGEDIWKHLKRNGISVESSLTGAARVEYVIRRNGQEIATAVSSSEKVHEEDEMAGMKLSSLIPAQGYYRVRTTETDLSLLFVTLLAFARSGASDDRGGNMKTIMGTLKKSGRT